MWQSHDFLKNINQLYFYLKFVQSFPIQYEVSTRGEIEEVTELGAFNEIEMSSDAFPQQKYYFDSIVMADVDTEFVICGIANAVTSTINNMLKWPNLFIF